jgi:hypothetical protein
MLGGAETQPALQSVVKVADRNAGHRVSRIIIDCKLIIDAYLFQAASAPLVGHRYNADDHVGVVDQPVPPDNTGEKQVATRLGCAQAAAARYSLAPVPRANSHHRPITVSENK